MGLPIHAIKKECRDSWIDTLRTALVGYATVAIVDDSTEEMPSVYVVGNHGYFTIHQEVDRFPDYVLILILPFYCNVKADGQDMANLEERIHRVFDTMNMAFEPEEIERYEKSRWTRFFRYFGWEHVGSLNFAHRPKRDIVEGDFDSEPIRSRFNPEAHVRCKPELKELWTEIFRERLEGRATVHSTSSSITSAVTSSRTIVSPNGKYSIEAPIFIEIKSENEYYALCGEGENGVCWISLSCEQLNAETRKKLRSKPIGRIVDNILREIAVDKEIFEEKALPTSLNALPKTRSKIILATGLIFFGLAFSIFVCCFSCTIEMLFDPLPTPHGLVTLPIAIGAAIVAALQYRALFCCPPIAARVFPGWLSVIYGLPMIISSIIGMVAMIIDPANNNEIALSITLVGVLAGVGLLSLDISATVAMKRRRRMAVDVGLPGIELLKTKTSPFRDYWKQELFGIVLAVVITSFVCWSWIRLIPPASGEYPNFSRLPFVQVPAFKNFPKDGHDFKYRRAHRHRMFCEFTISEQGFKDWVVSQKQWTGYEETHDYLVPTQGLAPDLIQIVGLRTLPKMENGPSAAFDRQTRKAYYWKH